MRDNSPPKDQGGAYQDAHGVIQGESSQAELVKYSSVPPRAVLDESDLIIILGELKGADQTLKLGGRLRLALEDGATVVFCYSARLGQVDVNFLNQIVPGLAVRQLVGHVSPVLDQPPLHSTFRTYLVEHGRTDAGFVDLGDGETLAAGNVLATAAADKGGAFGEPW